MGTDTDDRIEKSIELKAPVSRVWRAVTDHEEFGQWFRVALDSPFVVGETVLGQVTLPGYEHLKWKAEVRVMQPERLFSYAWYPFSDETDSAEEVSGQEIETLVEFRLEPRAEGTLLVITESGFSAQPDSARRADVLLRNSEGWEAQTHNIAAHVEG